jgi:hypothetical protein
MLEVTIWSLLVGNLGWQALVVSGWLRWQQIVTRQQDQEEEEILTCFESKEDSAWTKPPQRNGKSDPSGRPSAAAFQDPQLVGGNSRLCGLATIYFATLAFSTALRRGGNVRLDFAGKA